MALFVQEPVLLIRAAGTSNSIKEPQQSGKHDESLKRLAEVMRSALKHRKASGRV
ncbi:hypothetical protein [Paenibacillus apiarius]|uniref:hypothetical protein n=1 Tax=Paenibacillus apiarius TaxID=46240 RepID=UPI00197D6C49|nr:hypothetical protein [Paenibacillus apiarius]MBN3526368.1 hypothetical protein [Paenibacillus apiarius]